MKLYLLSIVIILVGCGRYTIESQSRLLFADKEFMSGDITVDKGCSMVVTPLVYKENYLEAPTVVTLAQPLSSRHDFLSVYSLEEAAALLATETTRDSLLTTVPKAIKKSDILELGVVSPLIRKAGIAFFQTIIIKDMASVETASGEELRKIKLEIEIWDTRKRQVLWRAEGESRTLNQRLSDEEVLMSTIKELYQLLPKFYFNTVHETW